MGLLNFTPHSPERGTTIRSSSCEEKRRMMRTRRSSFAKTSMKCEAKHLMTTTNENYCGVPFCLLAFRCKRERSLAGGSEVLMLTSGRFSLIGHEVIGGELTHQSAALLPTSARKYPCFNIYNSLLRVALCPTVV